MRSRDAKLVELYLVSSVTSFIVLATVFMNFFDKPQLNDLCSITVGGYIGYVGSNSIGDKGENNHDK